MEENSENYMECVFCGRKHAQAIKKGGWTTIYIVSCHHCSARGQSHFTMDFAEREWKTLLDMKNEQRRARVSLFVS